MIIAFDTSSKRTGWVRGEPGGPVRFGSFGLREGSGRNLGRMLAEWADFAWPLIEGCEKVYFEAPILPYTNANLNTLRMLYSIAAHVEFLAHHLGIPAVEIDNGKHKQLIYGKGGAKPANPEQFAAAWGVSARNDDEADALGIFLYAVRLEYPKAFNRWVTIRGQSPLVARIERPKKASSGARRRTRQRKTAKPAPSLF